MSHGYKPIVPASPAFRPDGTLYSEQFDDVYASAHGSLEQARHVFLNGNNLPERWRSPGPFVIIETGFGAGLNFLATWQLWKQTAPADARLDFISVEKHPFSLADLQRIHAAFPELAPLARQLHENWPTLLPGFHRLHFEGGRLNLTLLLGEAAESLAQLEASADAFFLDGFAPARNPAMWTKPVFRELARLAKPGATFATYTVASSVREGLGAAGFAVEKRQGFIGKREMLAGRYAGSRAYAKNIHDKRAIVVGAGLAGSTCAQRLNQRGWAVQVIEGHTAPAQEASGNPAG
ncbi:MAG TPA: tRNA (5-methylaminomethyl-2-thiouridine)(34)-methyltransferase MnmD, partial [Burkholderiales bacterium]